MNNSGQLTVTSTARNAYGIYAFTDEAGSPVSVFNSGDMTVSSQGYAPRGIVAKTFDPRSPISIVNTGDLFISGDAGSMSGIFADAFDNYNDVSIANSGGITVINTEDAAGIDAESTNLSPITIRNSGRLTVQPVRMETASKRTLQRDHHL